MPAGFSFEEATAPVGFSFEEASKPLVAPTGPGTSLEPIPAGGEIPVGTPQETVPAGLPPIPNLAAPTLQKEPEPEGEKIGPQSAWDAVQTSSTYRKLFGEDKPLGRDPGLIPILASSPLPFGLEGKAGKALMAFYIGSYVKDRPQAAENILTEFESGDTKSALHDVLGEIIQAGMIGVGTKSVFGKPSTPEVTDASKIGETEKIHGDVRPLETPAEGMPVPESGPRIQLQGETQKSKVPLSPIAEQFKSVIGREPNPEEVKQVESGAIELPPKSTPEVIQPEKQIPLGAATAEEFPGDPGDPDIYAIRQVSREARAKAGQVAEVEPGKGIAAPDSVEQGRKLIEAGNNPEVALTNFEATKKLGHDDIAMVRAEGERLAQASRLAEEKFGTDSPEYRASWKALSDWDTRTKPMQTEWHKMGMAQQGETDIDTGSFTGLRRAFQQDTGKDLPEAKVPKARKVAQGVKQAQNATEEAQKNFEDYIRSEGKTRSQAERDALQAVHTRHQEIGRLLAEAERKALVAKSAAEKKAAELQRKLYQKQLDEINKKIRQQAIKIAEAERKESVAKADLPRYVWTKAREYIDRGETNFDDIRHKLATDLGMSVEKVTEAMGKDRKAKFLQDDLWKKQQTLRRLDEQAKRWLREASTPNYKKWIQSVPRALFTAKVMGHGTVALGTHAPMVLFQPRYFNNYVKNFINMYKMVGSPTFYESQVQDLLRRPNYLVARRAGLVNDPYQYEDYNSPDVMSTLGKLTAMGNRGYSVLKFLRQDMFDQNWNKLPKTSRIQENAEALANSINPATGVVKVSAPKGAAVAFFAPRLELSRVAWLAADPIKMADTFLDWKNATEGQKTFALYQLKEKLWVAGTMYSLLALNQGFLSAIDSKQKINGVPESLGGGGIDPMKSDFLKFKAAGLQGAYGNAMLAMARLPARLFLGVKNEGKLNKIVYEDENVASILFDFTRSQMSPFLGTVTDLGIGRDFQRRPLPRAAFGLLPGKTNVPKRLRAQGVGPYTWAEYLTPQFLPIPAEEAVKEVWKHGLGMSDDQVSAYMKSFAIFTIMMGTGARVQEDYSNELRVR